MLEKRRVRSSSRHTVPAVLTLLALGSLSHQSAFAAAGTGGAPDTGNAPAASGAAPAPTTAPSTATGAATTASSASAPPIAGAAVAPPPVDPHAAAVAAAAGDMPQPIQLLAGDPYSSETHRQQAELARSGRNFQPETISRAEVGMRAGSIGVLLRDFRGVPLAGQKVILKRTKESIAEGNKTDELTTTSNAEGHAGFLDQSTNSDFTYEVITHEGAAQYATGQFRLDRQNGQIVVLNVYPTTTDINRTFLVTRALFVVEPRDDVFQIQTLYRFHNTNPMTWVPDDFRVPLPKGWHAFRPASATGDLHLIEENGSVRIKGSFGPGEHELSFSYQLDNLGESNAHLQLPLPPHTVDAKVYVESSTQMGLTSPNLEPAAEARGKQGQRALMAMRDFLNSESPLPKEISATITGLPTHGFGAMVAAGIAALVAGAGAFAASRGRRLGAIAVSDKAQARELLLSELVALEKARREERIGPKTYEQTRRSLLDAMVRIEATES